MSVFLRTAAQMYKDILKTRCGNWQMNFKFKIDSSFKTLNQKIMKNHKKILSLKSTLLLIFLGFLAISCARHKDISLVSPLSNSEKTLQNQAKIDLTIEKKDSKEELKAIDFTKSYAEIERYFRLASSWKKLQCAPKSGFICTKHECVKREIDSYLIIDRDKKIVKKCEKEVCETFQAEISQMGIFVNVQSTGAIGSLIRILGDSRYKEISTVGLDAYIANGNCSPLLN
jgi:hypothetical protein